VKVVQERLGHASAQVALNTYAHLMHDAQSRAAAALDDLLDGSGIASADASSS
jgi:integrase